MFQQFQLEIFLRNFGHGHLTDILLNEKLEALFSSEKSYFKRTRVTDKKTFFPLVFGDRTGIVLTYENHPARIFGKAAAARNRTVGPGKTHNPSCSP